jgi:hypothetical protein
LAKGIKDIQELAKQKVNLEFLVADFGIVYAVTPGYALQ